MKQRSRYLMIGIVLLIWFSGFYSIFAAAQEAEVEIKGKIGGATEETVSSSSVQEQSSEETAKPKEDQILLGKLPSTGEKGDIIALTGIILLSSVLISWYVKKAAADEHGNRL